MHLRGSQCARRSRRWVSATRTFSSSSRPAASMRECLSSIYSPRSMLRAFEVDAVGYAPDFRVCGHGYEWAVEATTTNPSGGAPPPPLPENRTALQEYIDGELVVRLGSALFSKLNKRYWDCPKSPASLSSWRSRTSQARMCSSSRTPRLSITSTACGRSWRSTLTDASGSTTPRSPSTPAARLSRRISSLSRRPSTFRNLVDELRHRREVRANGLPAWAR
jgi:hypothetical protein